MALSTVRSRPSGTRVTQPPAIAWVSPPGVETTGGNVTLTFDISEAGGQGEFGLSDTYYLLKRDAGSDSIFVTVTVASASDTSGRFPGGCGGGIAWWYNNVSGRRGPGECVCDPQYMRKYEPAFGGVGIALADDEQWSVLPTLGDLEVLCSPAVAPTRSPTPSAVPICR